MTIEDFEKDLKNNLYKIWNVRNERGEDGWQGNFKVCDLGVKSGRSARDG